jgi:hypothetical protein
VEVFLERLLVEVLALALQLALWRLLEWVGDRSGVHGQPVALPTTA